MIVGLGSKVVNHSVREEFGRLLRCALHGTPVYVAHGPIYPEDPAASLLAPFIRSASEAGLDPDLMARGSLAPDHILEKAGKLRKERVVRWDDESSESDWTRVEDWTRAGLVLEVASRVGIPMRGGGRAHVKWKLYGTVTGRFGVESGGFNPLVIPRERRGEVVPSAHGRSIVSIDFRAIDLSSMLSLAPGLKDQYVGASDLHSRTAEIVGLEREVAKKELFVYAYGGHSPHTRLFQERLPGLKYIRGTSSVEAAANARLVQKTSATAFKAALSRALPLLVGEGIRPLFTVHDELTLDVLNESLPTVRDVAKALEEGASERIGAPYSTGMTVGRNYAEAKAS